MPSLLPVRFTETRPPRDRPHDRASAHQTALAPRINGSGAADLDQPRQLGLRQLRFLWTRVSDKVRQSMTLWQNDWSIAYPWDAAKGTSVLRQRNTVIASGVCDADYAVDNPAPAPAPYMAPPNTYQAGNGDAVPFTYDNGAIFVAAAIGGRPVTMQVDTGANVCTIPEALANELIASGEATELQQSSSELADGQFHTFRHISVSMLVVGNHWGKDIQMTVMPSGTPLLSLPVLLSSGNGKFTVDAVKRKITFG